MNNLKNRISELQKVTAQSKINWNIKVYKDKSSADSKNSFNFESNTEFRLLTAVAIIFTAVFIAIAIGKIRRILKKFEV